MWNLGPRFDKTQQTALAIGAFATTLTTLSFALMQWRGLTVTNVFIGDFFFVAGKHRNPEKSAKTRARIDGFRPQVLEW